MSPAVGCPTSSSTAPASAISASWPWLAWALQRVAQLHLAALHRYSLACSGLLDATSDVRHSGVVGIAARLSRHPQQQLLCSPEVIMPDPCRLLLAEVMGVCRSEFRCVEVAADGQCLLIWEEPLEPL